MQRWLCLALVLLACGSDDGDGLSGPVAPAAGQGGTGGATAGAGGAGAAQGGNAGQGGGMVCAPGASVACVGPGACQGGQVCRPDGSGYDPCDCGTGGAGAGGQPGAGSGGGCSPLPAQKACASNQCGQAPDGCGGLVACPVCDPWLKCEAQPGGTSLCAGNCKAFDEEKLAPEIRDACLKKTQGKVQVQECSWDQFTKPDGCLITKNPGVGGQILCCPPVKDG